MGANHTTVCLANVALLREPSLQKKKKTHKKTRYFLQYKTSCQRDIVPKQKMIRNMHISKLFPPEVKSNAMCITAPQKDQILKTVYLSSLSLR